MGIKFVLLLFAFVFCANVASAQDMARIFGTVIDENGQKVMGASVAVVGGAGAITDENGKFDLKVSPGEKIELVVSHLSYERKSFTYRLLVGEQKQLNITLSASKREISIVEIEEDRYGGTGKIAVDPEAARKIATPGDPVMNLIKSAGLGVTTNNELSSGYNVRGGNFDENLIYINDIEIYRPFLARSGQQEGLSFINSDMVESIAFSSGGFEARYGDKMSSVLDINYKKPTTFKASLSGGLLGVNAHAEGTAMKKRLKYLTGYRYRSNNYVLSSLDTKGGYKPDFMDWQAQLIYDVSEKVEISLLGIYSNNRFNFIPQNRETDFGTINQALRFKVFFDGQEKTGFRTGIGAFTLAYKPTQFTTLKFIGSYTDTKETETFDIQGQYFLSEIDNNLGSDNFGGEKASVGVGTFINHARNTLNARIASLQHRGTHNIKNTTLRWGVQYQNEQINDRMREWNVLDSSGYLIPHFGPKDTSAFGSQNFINSKINLVSHRLSGFYENSFQFLTKDSTKITLTVGLRAQYWTVNREFLLSPRMNLSFKPAWKKSFVFRLAGGVYYQAPFYRELRNPFGSINTDVKAQRSIHAILGMDYVFKMWKRPFKFTAEGYYKHLSDLNPYQIDNVRIRYYAQNIASGYATGVDLKINGEFIKGLESWATLSVMTTQEDVQNDDYYRKFDSKGNDVTNLPQIPATDSMLVSPGYLFRPTDQRISFSIFFQDEIRNNPNFKVHLNLLVGTGFPFGPGTFKRYQDVFRMPFYRRVDIGFSAQLLRPNRKTGKSKVMKYIKAAWASLEVFNLLGINNTVSYDWVKDNNGNRYSVPNYSTPRLINARLIFDF